MRTLIVLIQLLVADRQRLMVENLALRHQLAVLKQTLSGEVCVKPVLSGLHHRYFRVA